MAQRQAELFPERSPAHALGAELRRLRLDHGLSQAGLGKLVYCSGATVGKIEKAQRLPTAEFCSLVDAALQTGGRLSQMWPTVNPRIAGVPAELVVLPWNAETSLRLLRELGRPSPHHDFVVLTGANLDIVRYSWCAAAPATGPAVPAVPVSDPAFGMVSDQFRPGLLTLDLIAARLDGLRAQHDVLDDGGPGGVLGHVASAELRCLIELINRSTLTTPEHRRLLGLTADAARLCGRLLQDNDHPGSAQRFHLVALRCAADAGDRVLGAQIFTEMCTASRTPHRPHLNVEDQEKSCSIRTR